MSCHIVEKKGASDGWAMDRLLDDVKMFGHTAITLKSDGEPALVQMQEEIARRREHSTVMQNPPAYDPQANGAIERGVQEVAGQIRAMKIGLEQRLGARVTTKWKIFEWMVELSTVLLNRCLVGHDGKTPYARLMGKNSSQPIVEVGERVLAKVARSSKTKKKRALKSRWIDAIWVGIARRSNEHIVVIEGGGRAMRCRTIKRRPADRRWSAEKLAGVKATPRRPNPKDAHREEGGTNEEPLVEIQETKGMAAPEVREPVRPPRRNFKITRKVLEKYDYTSGCAGCEATLEGRQWGGRDHTAECRARIERAMAEDPVDLRRILERDERLGRKASDEGIHPGRARGAAARAEAEAVRPQAAAQPPAEAQPAAAAQPAVYYPSDREAMTAQPPAETAAEDRTERERMTANEGSATATAAGGTARNPDREEGGIDSDADDLEDVLYGCLEPPEVRPATRARSEDESAEDEAGAKRRRLALLESLRRSKKNIMDGSRMKLESGSKYKLGLLLKDLAAVDEPKAMAKQDVTEIFEELAAVEKLSDRQDMESPHSEENLTRLYEDVVFYDDVHGGCPLEKEKVIEARVLEMKIFRTWEFIAKCPDPR